jgi:hypothetical protein
MTRFWLRFIAVCALLAGLCFAYLGGSLKIEFLIVLAVVFLITSLVCSLLASRCPYCGHINRYGIWDEYCGKCGGSLDD